MEKGQITVFLSLVFTFLLSIICTAAEGVRVQGLALEGKLALAAAAHGLLSEYDRDLLDAYEVFYINGTMDNGKFSSEKVGEKLAGKISRNLSVDYGNSGIVGGNFLQARLNTAEAGNFVLATDGDGWDFFKQVVEYEEKRLGIDVVEALVEQATKGSEIFSKGEEMERQIQEKETEFESLEEENKETEQSFSQEDLGETNPLTQMEDNEAQGIWKIILQDKEVSGKTMDLSQMLTGRELLSGIGVGEEESLKDKVLFNEYVMEKFNHVLEEKNEVGLSYEIEYILAGKGSDKENLESVINRLMIFREGVNYLYLHSDSGKVAQAEALATTLVGFTGLPPVITVVRELLLLSWAYGESLLDLRNLIAGGTLALIKTGENWQLELENVGNLMSEEKEVRKEAGGLSYENYLRVLLSLMNRETVTMRCMDLIELNVRQKEGKELFRLDCCFSQLQCNASYQAKTMFLSLPVSMGMLKTTENGYEFQVRRKICY